MGVSLEPGQVDGGLMLGPVLSVTPVPTLRVSQMQTIKVTGGSTSNYSSSFSLGFPRDGSGTPGCWVSETIKLPDVHLPGESRAWSSVSAHPPDQGPQALCPSCFEVPKCNSGGAIRIWGAKSSYKLYSYRDIHFLFVDLVPFWTIWEISQAWLEKKVQGIWRGHKANPERDSVSQEKVCPLAS